MAFHIWEAGELLHLGIGRCVPTGVATCGLRLIAECVGLTDALAPEAGLSAWIEADSNAFGTAKTGVCGGKACK